MTFSDLIAVTAIIAAFAFFCGYRVCSDMQRHRERQKRRELGHAILKP